MELAMEHTLMELMMGLGVRLLVLCPDQESREEAIHRFTGGTTLLTGKYELGIDQRFGPDLNNTDENTDENLQLLKISWSGFDRTQRAIMLESDSFRTQYLMRESRISGEI